MSDFEVVALPDEMPDFVVSAMPYAEPDQSEEMLTAYADDPEIEAIPLDDGPVADTASAIAEPIQPAPEKPNNPELDPNFFAFKNSMSAGMDRVLERSMVSPKPTSELVAGAEPKEVKNPDLQSGAGEALTNQLADITMSPEKWNYILQGAWQQSVTGSVLRGTFEQEIDKDLEGSLSFTDKLTRAALAMGPDVWLFAMGGAIPKIGSAAFARLPQAYRSLPLIESMMAKASDAVRAASSFGFFEGMRRMYMNKLTDPAVPDGKSEFTRLIGGTIYDSFKGMSVGLALGEGQALRRAVFGNTENALVGAAKATGILVPEAGAIAMLQTQLHNPGVLPELEDFALSAGLILGFEGYGQVKGLMARVKSGDIPVEFELAKRSYERYGVHPNTFAHDLLTNTKVMEDVSNVLRDGTVRDYEADGGRPEPKPEIVEEIRQIYANAKRSAIPEYKTPEQRTPEGIQEAQPSGQPNQPVPANAPPIQPAPGIEHPMQYYAGEVLDTITLPDGRRVQVPTDPTRALAMSETGLINNAFAVIFGTRMLEGMKIKAGSEQFDPRLKGAYGYFSPPEIGRSARELELAKEVKRANKLLRRATNKRDVTGQLAHQKMVNELTAELDKVRNEALSGHRSKIVINRILGELTPGKQLATLVHEIGHAISYAAEGWEQGGSPGVSTFFHKTLSGYPHMIGDILSYAQQHGLNYPQIYSEGRLLSRLWRPVSDDYLAQNPDYSNYRNTGAEMIADVVSVSLHRPDIIEKYAPSLHKAMERFYEARPDAKQRVDEMMDLIHSGDDMDAVIDALKASNVTEEQLLRAQKDVNSVALGKRTNAGVSKLLAGQVDAFQPLWDASKIPFSVQNAVQRYQFRGTVKQLYVTQLNNLVLRPLKKLGLDTQEVGLLLMFRRIASDTDRQNLFNVRGLDPVTAKEAYDRLAGRNQQEINNILSNFHEVRKSTILKEYERSGLYGDDFISTIMDNEFYARFSDMEHFQKWIEEGNYSSSGKRGSEVLDSKEAQRIKQIGSLGDVRNTFSSTLEMDLHMYDVILRESALKKLLDTSVASGDLPFIPAESFETISNNTPVLLGGYAKAEFRSFTLPTRVFDKKLQKYITVRQRWMAPKDVINPFMGAPSPVQQFISDLAHHSFAELVTKSATSKEGDRGKWAFKTLAKGMQNTNALARWFMITAGGSFQIANFLSYDPGRTVLQLPVAEGIPGVRRFEVFKHYPGAMWDLLKHGFTGHLSPRMQSLMDRGILSTRQRFVEEFNNTDLAERIIHEYGDSGFASKVDWKNQNLLYQVPKGVGELLQIVLSTLDSTSKYAADKFLEEKMASGTLKENISMDQKDMILREQVGSPAYSIKGDSAALGNSVFMFMSSILMATRGDWRAFKRNPTAWATGAGMFAVASIIQGLAKNGAFDGSNEETDDEFGNVIKSMLPASGGPSISHIMSTKDSRTHNSNWVVPISIKTETGEGLSFAMPVPPNPAIRLMHVTTLALIDALALGLKEDPNDPELKPMWDQLLGIGSSFMRSSLDAGGSASPGMTPVFGMIKDLKDILLTGNTYDAFTNREKFNEDIPSEGMQRPLAAVKTIPENMGVSKNIRNFDQHAAAITALLNPGPDETEKSLTSRLVDVGITSPFIGDGWNRVIKLDNKGLAERSAKENKQKAEDAVVRRQNVDKFLEEVQAGTGDFDIFEHPERGEITRALLLSRLKKNNIKNLDNKYLQNILERGTNSDMDYARSMAPHSSEARQAVITIEAINANKKRRK